jgi:hypothetical protein
VPGAVTDFTPFGYLRNPAHQARSWTDTEGGNLRAAPDRVGVEWVYPVGRDPSSRVGLGIQTVVDGRACRGRADFDALGLTSRYHSCLIFGFDWQIDGLQVEARFFLVDQDALGLRLQVVNTAVEGRRVQLGLIGWVDDQVVEADRWPSLTEPPTVHAIVVFENGPDLDVDLDPGESRQVLAVLTRGPSRAAVSAAAVAALGAATDTLPRLLEEDAVFNAHCPTLFGDWPAHWPEGLHHDFETTRLLVQPAGGIFADVWPSWMAAWPRVVMAEGTLDMLRLAYADPALAQRAVFSLFRDAVTANVPCVFQGGEYNMLAADGSPCGTSPAWCLPFLNLELLYLRTLDRHWLAQVYPYLAAYLDWWLEQRVDVQGWLVYKCTWESGEDGNPRLDPSGTGDADISRRVRPVELQATVAHAAGVLQFFAAELGRADDVPRWQAVHAAYRQRTRRLFDPHTERYRDWLIAEQRFSPASADGAGGALYWGIDAYRYSAQSLTPLLIGEPLAEVEVWRHVCAPWTLWPSWTWSLVESASAAGLYAGVGKLARATIDRVYRVTTRRQLGSLARPLPGCAPEFWPEDWRTYGGSDAYGWGATTANLLIRHLFGFKESRQTDGWVAELTPALPDEMLSLPNARYGMRNLSYRGLVFDLCYVVEPRGVRAELELLDQPRTCGVEQLEPLRATIYPAPHQAARAQLRHTFELQMGARYAVRLSS